MSDTLIALVAAAARDAAANEPDLIERLRKCMKAARGHFMVTEENLQLAGALAAALRLTEGPDHERLDRSIKGLARFNATMNALQAGVPVDLGGLLARQEQEKAEGFERIPIIDLWHESRVKHGENR